MDNMKIDTLRALFTYLIAFIVVVGGGVTLVATRLDPAGGDLRVIIAGFIGSALTFAFGAEVQARTGRQAAAATAAAADISERRDSIAKNGTIQTDLPPVNHNP